MITPCARPPARTQVPVCPYCKRSGTRGAAAVTGTGLTVPGGDPAALRQLAAQLRTAAQRSGSLGSNTSDLTGAITSDAQWTGTASNSFTTFSANLSEDTSAAEAPLNRIADAVENYANVLDVAQQKAQTANAILQTAQDDPTGSLISTAEVEVAQRARQRLADLVQPLAVGVHELHGLVQARRKVLADDRAGPGLVVVEQPPRRRLLRAVLAQEAVGQPRRAVPGR